MHVSSVRKYKIGYEVRTEQHDGTVWNCPPFAMKSAYTSDGLYLGDPKSAHYLCKKRQITHFELRTPTSNVASIGFAESTNTWYGWSHRAIFGFTIGSTIESEDHCCYPELSVGFTAQTIDDAKRMACVFAESVS